MPRCRSSSSDFRQRPDVDESILRNLDTQHRRLAEIEAEADRLLAGEDGLGLPAAPAVPLAYADLTVANDALRADRGWSSIDLDDALTPELRAEFAAWQVQQRLPWTLEDAIVVALAGVVGVGATWFDTTIDHAVRGRLNGLTDSELICGWERSGKRMPIDYMGAGFGGKAHRVRSAGHDIGRPFEALGQIRSGEFRGFRWEDGVRIEVRNGGYPTPANLAEALTLWAKHLAADVVTPMSLPLPGWTRLYELDSRQLRIFAHQAYLREMNLRSEMLKTLPAITTEVIVRSHVHGRAMLDRGSAKLEPAEVALRTELLLASHAIVGAASLGKALGRTIVLPPMAAPVAAAVAFRHVNWPVLMRAATLSIQVAADHRARAAVGATSWDDLLLDVAGPWQLDMAREVDDALADTGS